MSMRMLRNREFGPVDDVGVKLKIDSVLHRSN
jgi:hypothetical protein